MKKIDNNLPLVSICCITYNHERYIRDAIDGFLAQKTTFPFEIVISDDCSKDNTRAIITELKQKNPQVFRDVSPEHNLGMYANFLHVFNKAKGAYIALCDGDDYWTDPYKLQKQVDILEANESLVACCTDCIVVEGEQKTILLDHYSHNIIGGGGSARYSLHDFFRDNHQYPTSTVMYRNEHREKILNNLQYLKNDFQGDWPLWICLLIYGDMYYLNEVTSAYRMNPASVSHTVFQKRSDYVKNSRWICARVADLLPEEYATVVADLRDTKWTWVPLMFAYKNEGRYFKMIGCLIVSCFVCPRNLWKAFKEGFRKRMKRR